MNSHNNMNIKNIASIIGLLLTLSIVELVPFKMPKAVLSSEDGILNKTALLRIDVAQADAVDESSMTLPSPCEISGVSAASSGGCCL